MRPLPPRALTLALILAFLPVAALAHTGAGGGHGLARGLVHPLGGLDHVLAMLTVGLFAFQLGGRAVWLVPLAFVAAMSVGGLLGMLAVPLPGVGIGIAASVVVLGTLVALAVRAPVAAATTMVGVLAVFHGHAHGSEMPLEVSAAAYAAGFALATALLHAGGLALGAVLREIGDDRGPIAARIGGTAVAAAGVAILASTIW